MRKIKINVISEDNLDAYKAMRLTSLKDTPDAFGSTYDRELAFSNDIWKSRISPQGNTLHLLPLLIEYDGINAGLASGAVHKQDSNSAHLYQMWVAPEFRGKGLGKALLSRIKTWAEELHLEKVLLSVTTSNTNAFNLYKSFGFMAVGNKEPLREGSELFVQPMSLNLEPI